jgi:hypothetical protein
MVFLALTLAFALQGSGTPVKPIDSGQNSPSTAARQVVARSAQEWESLWRSVSPTRAMPAVDFSKDMVVGVFLGQRPTAGYGVQIVRTREDRGNLIVDYRETRPPAGTMSAQVITAPYQIATVPKFAGEVRFEKVD